MSNFHFLLHLNKDGTSGIFDIVDRGRNYPARYNAGIDAGENIFGFHGPLPDREADPERYEIYRWRLRDTATYILSETLGAREAAPFVEQYMNEVLTALPRGVEHRITPHQVREWVCALPVLTLEVATC